MTDEITEDIINSDSRNGYVEIIDGKINITNPRGLGRYPRIAPGENINLFVEDEKINEELVVSKEIEKDINIKISYPEKKKNIKLEIIENNTKAILKTDIIPERELKIKDKGPANKVTIETEIIRENYPDITQKEILDLMEKEGIQYGIKNELIKKICDNTKNLKEKYIIAEGKKPIPGSDAKIIKTKDYKDHKENFFNTIDSFEKGEVICYKQKAEKGEAGIDIFNNKIPPPPVKDMKLKAGKNVKLSPDGLKAIAITGGQPKILKQKNKVIAKIVKQYVINGDIDKHTGNIKYEGDLLINGNIQDYFNVKVGHDLKVKGSVANATINSDGNVYVNNNIISSKLNIGRHLDPEIIDSINLIINELDNFKKALDEIIGEANKRKIYNFKAGKVIKLLFENKFQKLSNKILDTKKMIPEDNELKKEFQKIFPYINNFDKMKKLANENVFLDFKFKLIDYLNKQNNSTDILNIYTGYIQNSDIKVNGSVFINKKGCYNSNIDAKNCIIVKNSDGFLRGGNYQAGKLIYANKAGSRLGKTYFYVGEKIYVFESLGTLVIKTNGDKKVIDGGIRNICFTVDKFGKLKKSNNIPDISDIENKII